MRRKQAELSVLCGMKIAEIVVEFNRSQATANITLEAYTVLCRRAIKCQVSLLIRLIIAARY